jgi:hypothetical protein
MNLMETINIQSTTITESSNEAFLQKFVAFTEDSLLEELFEALSAKIKR